MSESHYEPSRKGRRSRSAQRPLQGSVWQRFVADLKDVRERYMKRTSTPHKRWVAFLVIGGALLRAWMLFQPITADEAMGYLRFATLPVGQLVGDMGHYTNHVLHTLLVKASTGLFGVSSISVRLPAYLAGVLVMPLFYLFVRAMFNRYIALMALALVAGSGGLVEYSALSRGFSLAWLFMVMALLAGRHFIKEDNLVSGLVMGLCAALGIWSVPTAMYGILMVYIWVLLSLLVNYERSLDGRLLRLGLSFMLTLVLAVLFYLPVIMDQGVDQLFRQGDHSERNWVRFAAGHADAALDVWVYLSETATIWVALLGFAGLVHAAYISTKFRTLLLAMFLGAVPMVLVIADVGQPRKWLYTLFIFHLSSAIALFYLLKFLQERVFPSLGKRERSAAASVLLFIGLGFAGARVIVDRVPREQEVVRLVAQVRPMLEAGDRVVGEPRTDAVARFMLRSEGVPLAQLKGPPGPGGTVFVVLSDRKDWSVDQVLRLHQLDPGSFSTPELVGEREGSQIFAARYDRGASAGTR